MKYLFSIVVWVVLMFVFDDAPGWAAWFCSLLSYWVVGIYEKVSERPHDKEMDV